MALVRHQWKALLIVVLPSNTTASSMRAIVLEDYIWFISIGDTVSLGRNYIYIHLDLAKTSQSSGERRPNGNPFSMHARSITSSP
jgi:hypothetical protein